MLRFASIGLLLATVAAASAQSPAPEGGGKPAQLTPPRVAVVNLKVVFDNYRRTKQLEDEINVAYRAKIAELKKLAEAAEGLKKQIQNMEPSKGRARKQRQLFLKQRELEFNQKWAELQFQEQINNMLIKLYKEILVAVDKYARANGIDLVLKIDRRTLGAKTQDQLKLQMHGRGVLFFADRLDITKAIIASLNQGLPAPPPEQKKPADAE